ncbi:MAG: copper-binding protein [Myxococcota bacterium]
MWLQTLAFLSCSSAPPTFSLTGEVVETRPPDEVVVAHDDIDGFMDAMTMPFHLADPAELQGLDPGDKIAATLVVASDGTVLRGVHVTEEAPEEAPPELAPGESVPEGKPFPSTPVRLAEGLPVTIGQGQTGRWAVTFIYTRCPVPEYCPLVVTRFQALQQALPEGARLLAITMDPEHDTRSVLAAFGEERGAVPGKWDFGVVPDEVLFGLAEKAGLKVTGKGLGIVHDLVLLILDEDGRLVKRYRDMDWDQAEVVKLLSPRG